MTDPTPATPVLATPRRAVLNAAAGSYAQAIPAQQQFAGGRGDGRREVGALPVWMDREGNLRIAVQTHEPEYAGDYDQIIVNLGSLLRMVGLAVEQQPEREL